MAAEAYQVVKRDGRRVPVLFDKITERNRALCTDPKYGPPLASIAGLLPKVTQKVVEGFKSGMTTHELDLFTAAILQDFSIENVEYGRLAARVVASDLHKTTAEGFEATVARLAGDRKSRISPELVGIARRGSALIEKRLAFARDYDFTYFGLMTMKKNYCLKDSAGATVERPQCAYMRVALAVCVGTPERDGHEAGEELFAARLGRALEAYDLLSTHRLTHASPTMFNAGTKRPQMSSCFLLSVDDNLETLLQVDKEAGLISKWAGGIGVNLTPMRAEGSLIASTGGRSSGIGRYLVKLNSSQLYVNQGGLRPGAYAAYLEIWHADVFTFLEKGRFKGVVDNAPDLKYALWVPDLFMEKMAAREPWHLFSPDEAPGLDKVYGEEFRELYARYVGERRFRRAVDPQEVMMEWYKTVCEKGNPYVLFKDHINRKSNLAHYRTITNSNLCAEITIPCFHEEGRPEAAEYGTCNLGAIPLASFVREGAVDWGGLVAAAGVAARNLDRVIDLTYYPVEACRRSNQKHRPIAIGVIGLADVLALCRLPFGSDEARRLDAALAAAVYYGAMRASAQMGAELGSFATFEGSAAQRGRLQPDLWVECGHLEADWADAIAETTGGAIAPEDWEALRAQCRRHLRNAYVTANMPTATSSQVTGQNECFEPFTSNLYPRKTQAGNFLIVNSHCQKQLLELGLWDADKVRKAQGSVLGLAGAPEDLKKVYKVAREIDQRLLTLHAAARNPFLSQTQSLNYFYEKPTPTALWTVLRMGWERGLTTGSYYIHSAPAQEVARPPVAREEAATCAGDSCAACAV